MKGPMPWIICKAKTPHYPMFRFFAHYGIHFIVPIVIAFTFFKERRILILLILWGGMLIDLDHFLVDPIYDANRCSLGFHPLHSYFAIGCYCLLLIPKKTRIIGLALVIHILADFVDCLFIGN